MFEYRIPYKIGINIRNTVDKPVISVHNYVEKDKDFCF
jgi:hypothetical protein